MESSGTLENVSWGSSNEINDVAFSSEGSGFYEEEFELSLNSVMGMKSITP